MTTTDIFNYTLIPLTLVALAIVGVGIVALVALLVTQTKPEPDMGIFDKFLFALSAFAVGVFITGFGLYWLS